MAKVPLRSGLLADVSNSESDHAAMKSLFSKNNGFGHDFETSTLSPEDSAAFSPRTDLANKLSHTSLICDDQAESDASNSPPLCTPNRRPGCSETKNKRNVVATNIGRMSPLVIADEQTKFPELDDSLTQKSVDAAWGRRRSCTFTELSTDSGFGSSSLQSWADCSQRSNTSSFSPSAVRPLAVINESSNFPFSPLTFSSEVSRESFTATESSCPSTPQHRLIALRSRSSRGSPLTPKHCSPSPSLPKHIQALVRGGLAKAQSPTATSPTAIKKPLGQQSLFANNSSERLSRTNSLKRVATSDRIEIESPQLTSSQPLLPLSGFEAKKMKSQLESIAEGAVSRVKRSSLHHSHSSSAVSTPLQQPVPVPQASHSLVEKTDSTSSAVTVTKTSPDSSSSHQAPPDTSLVGDGSRPYLLPCKPHESTVLIECSELANLLAGKYSSNVKDFHIIDCRYPYEHAGGHILGAVNHPKAEPLLKEFFEEHNPSNEPVALNENGEPRRTLLIFHCEFSSKRAPDMVKAFRKCDRDRNRNNYPKLDYPEVYMLQGGYKAFYEYCCETNQLGLLEPHGGYTPMHAEEHNQELRKWKKYKTMSAVEERLVKTGQSVISPLSASCSGNNSSETGLSLSQQEPSSFKSSDENNRHTRVTRRPLIRRQLSSFSVPHNPLSIESPLVQRSESVKLFEKATPLSSHMLNTKQQQQEEDAENIPPCDW